jgi:transcriptional regulator of NAD metabolism
MTLMTPSFILANVWVEVNRDIRRKMEEIEEIKVSFGPPYARILGEMTLMTPVEVNRDTRRKMEEIEETGSVLVTRT